MMAQPRSSRRRGNLVTGCVLPILGLIVFLAFCYGFCMVIFLVGNPAGSDAGSTGQILTALMG
jgi:hypothetical protein